LEPEDHSHLTQPFETRIDDLSLKIFVEISKLSSHSFNAHYPDPTFAADTMLIFGFQREQRRK
jgi:hypothetical protein